MSLYSNWNDMVVEYVKTKGEKAFWDEYSKIEIKIYENVVGNHNEKLSGKVNELAKKFNISIDFFMGFLDGINDSLKNKMDLESVEEETEVSLDVDFEKLYFNMLDASADYLYELPQWEGVFSKEKRNEIEKNYRKSKTVKNEEKIGRNDPCTCGSGKKYKKCCGK